MAITEYIDHQGNKKYRVHVSVRSKTNSSIRLQKAKKAVKTSQEATRLEKTMQNELNIELYKLETQGKTWEGLTELWKKALLNGEISGSNGKEIGIDTRLDYIRCVEIYTIHWNEIPVESLSSGDVKQVMLSVEQRNNSSSRKIKVVTAIKCVLGWGSDFGHIRRNWVWPTHGIKLSRKDAKIPGIMSLKHIKLFLEAAKFHKHPWYPIWALALQTGMRSGELRALEWNDVDFETNKISVTKSYKNQLLKSTKGGYWRMVPFNEETVALLREIRSQTGGAKYLLPRFPEWDKGEQAKVLRVFLASMGLPEVTFHNLRACWATQMLNNRVPSTVIMKIGGWMDIKAFQRYVRLAGVEIDGATASLQFLPKADSFANIVSLTG